MIIAIWAMDERGLIGNNGQLPWHNRAEMQHFRQTTLGHDVLMGSKTFLGMGSRPLPNRHNYILTSRNLPITSENMSLVNNLDDLLNNYKNQSKILYVCGGATIYQQVWNQLDKLIVSEMKGQFTGDVYFPDVDWTQFQLVKTIEHEDFKIKYYERVSH